jgi:hypothetical protein
MIGNSSFCIDAKAVDVTRNKNRIKAAEAKAAECSFLLFLISFSPLKDYKCLKTFIPF